MRIPSHITYFFSWRCNSRCLSCDTWRREPGAELSLGGVDRLFSAPLFRDVIWVYLTGGEPFLSGRIVDICEIIKKRVNATISLNTNGLLPENIEKYGRMIRDLGLKIHSVDLSINGPEEIHDLTRGTPNGFRRLMRSREVLERLGIPYGWTFTVFKPTAPYVWWFKDLRDGEPKTFAYGSSTRFLNSPKADQFNLSKDEINQVYADCGDEALRGYIDHLKTGTGYYDPCYMGSNQVRVDPTGMMYLCDYGKDFRLGVPWEIDPRDYERVVSEAKRRVCAGYCAQESCIHGFNQVMSRPQNRVLLYPSVYRSLKRFG